MVSGDPERQYCFASAYDRSAGRAWVWLGLSKKGRATEPEVPRSMQFAAAIVDAVSQDVASENETDGKGPGAVALGRLEGEKRGTARIKK